MTRAADFLMCAERGCYVAATITFDDEPADPRVAGRWERWTPAVLVEAQPNA